MPTRRPTPKVTAAARMPSSICRSPLYHQGRLVNRAVSTTVVCGTLPPATPAISAKFDTRPSITPKTAGRSQPPVTSRWRWWISIEPAGDSRGGSAVTVRGYVGGLSVRDRAGRLPGLAGPLRGLADHLPGLADHLPGLADHLARFGLDHLVGLADRLAGG